MAMVPLLKRNPKPQLQLTKKRKKATKKRNDHRLKNVIGLVHVTKSVTGRGLDVDPGHGRGRSVHDHVDGLAQGIKKDRGPGIKNGLVLEIRRGHALAIVRSLGLEIGRDLDLGIKKDLVRVTVSVRVRKAGGQRAALILPETLKHLTKSGHAGIHQLSHLSPKTTIPS